MLGEDQQLAAAVLGQLRELGLLQTVAQRDELGLLPAADGLVGLHDQALERRDLDAHLVERLGHHDPLGSKILLGLGRVVLILLGVGERLGELELAQAPRALRRGQRLELDQPRRDAVGALAQRRADRAKARSEAALQDRAGERDSVAAAAAGRPQEVLDVLRHRHVELELRPAELEGLGDDLALDEQLAAVLVHEIILLTPQEVRGVRLADLLGGQLVDGELVGVQQPQEVVEAAAVTGVRRCRHQQQALAATAELLGQRVALGAVELVSRRLGPSGRRLPSTCAPRR